MWPLPLLAKSTELYRQSPHMRECAILRLVWLPSRTMNKRKFREQGYLVTGFYHSGILGGCSQQRAGRSLVHQPSPGRHQLPGIALQTA